MPASTEGTPTAVEALDPEAALARAQQAFSELPEHGDASRVLQLAKSACDRGLADACVAEAVLLRNGIGEHQDLARSIALLMAGCAAGHGAACTELGVHHDLPWGVPWDQDEARRRYRAGADGGDSEGLVRLAQLEHRALDTRAALELADEACRAGNPRGCILAFDIDVLGRDSPAGAARVCDAVAALERDCTGGSIRTAARSCLALSQSTSAIFGDLAPSCPALAEWKARQPASSREERQRAWARAACDLRSIAGCSELGTLTHETPEGVALLRRSCAHDDHDACEWLAYDYFHDWVGTQFDRARSIELYARVCQRGSRYEACRMWETYCGDDTFPCPPPSEATPDDRNAPRSDVCGTALECFAAGRSARSSGKPERAAELHEEACRLGSAEACFRLGDMHTTGELGKRAIEAALPHYARACDLGHAMACVAAGAYRLDAAGDQATACRSLERACTLGEDGGCDLARRHCAAPRG